MLLHCRSTQGQLRLTCTFSAECAQAEDCGGGCGATAWPGFKGFRRFKGFRGGGIALRAMSILPPVGGSAAIGSENHTTAPTARRKCTPIPATQDFPRRGKFALYSALGLISTSKHSAAKISPSGGDAAEGGRRGAFPRTQGRLACFPSPARAAPRFYHHGAFHYVKAPTTLLSGIQSV